MNKKFFKYILTIFVFMSINVTYVFAKPQTVDSKVETACVEQCTYTYGGATVIFRNHEDAKLEVRKGGYEEVAVEVSEQQIYSDYLSMHNCVNESSFTCNPLKVYESTENGKKYLELFQPSDPNSNLTSPWVYKGQISGTGVALTTACKYTSLHNESYGQGVFWAKRNPITGAMKFQTDDNFDVVSNGHITDAVQDTAKWQVDSANNLQCRDDIAIDMCNPTLVWKFRHHYTPMTYVREVGEPMYDNCDSSTNPGTLIIKPVDDSSSNSPKDEDSLARLCEKDNVRRVVKFIGYLGFAAKILVPIGLIVFGIISLFKVVMSGDADELKKSLKSFAFKAIAAIIIFLLPGIINMIVNLIDDEDEGTQDYTSCVQCVLNPGKCK